MKKLSLQDRMAVGVFVAYLLFVVASLWLEYGRTTTTTRTTDRNEELLDRLERGETVRVPRWHGHDLELSGSLIVDADALDDDPDDETDEDGA